MKILLLLIVFSTSLFSNELDRVDVGLNFNKSIGLYWENGINVELKSEKYFYSNKLGLGIAYYSSRLGSALGSNALKQDNFLIYPTYDIFKNYFIGRLNLGYFSADYENPIFDVLDNSAFIIAPEIGTSYHQNKFKFYFGLAYNLTAGNGISGPGSLYPYYLRFQINYRLK